MSASVQVNLTPEEKAFIEKKAAAEGVTLSEYFAIAALKALPSRLGASTQDQTVKAAAKTQPKKPIKKTKKSF